MKFLERRPIDGRTAGLTWPRATCIGGSRILCACIAAFLGLTVVALDAFLPPEVAVGFFFAVPIFLVGVTFTGRTLLMATALAFAFSAADLARIPDSVDTTAFVLNSLLAATLVGASAIGSWVLHQLRSRQPGAAPFHVLPGGDGGISNVLARVADTADANHPEPSEYVLLGESTGDLPEETIESFDAATAAAREARTTPEEPTGTFEASPATAVEEMHLPHLQSLATSEERFRSLLDRMGEGVFGMDASGNSTFCNPACARMLGYGSPEEMLHRCVHELINHSRPDERPLDPGDCKICGVLRTGEEQACDQDLFWRADGTCVPVEYRAFPIIKDGVVTGAVVTFWDITDRLASERRLREREEQLRHSQRMEAVGQLAGGVAHEYNNLLQTIRGFTRFAQQSLAPGVTAYEDLEHVLSACDRAAGLTRQLLNFSRSDAMCPAPIAVQEVLEDVADMLRSCLPASVDLRVSISDGDSVIFVDPGLLQQVLMNLCINAQEAMDSVGSLRISCQRVFLDREDAGQEAHVVPGPYVQLSVTDTGTGIPEEVQERIFDPFFTTKDVGEGTGLGLAQVFALVRQHHGFVRVESQVGEGATFRVYLPVHQEEEAIAGELPHANPVKGGNELILIAEDEPMVRKLAVRILEGAGYRTLVAKDGEEAVEHFSAHADEIDMLLLDLVMPAMGGKETAATIRLIRPDIPVAFCTGYDAPSATIKNKDTKSTFIVEKPFDGDRLLQTVRAALDNQREQRGIESFVEIES